MNQDHSLRLPLRWKFEMVPGPASAWWWRWSAYENGTLVLRSPFQFETLTECIADAKRHGYLEPEQRR